MKVGTVIHQDSKTNPKWEKIQGALPSNLCAIHHATNLVIQKLVKTKLSIQSKTKFLHCEAGHAISKLSMATELKR